MHIANVQWFRHCKGALFSWPLVCAWRRDITGSHDLWGCHIHKPVLCAGEVILCLNQCHWRPLEVHGCFPRPDLLLEFKCSLYKHLDFVEVDTILEKAFTCHMHENLTGFSLSPDWNKSTDVTSLRFLSWAVKPAGIRCPVSRGWMGKVKSSLSLRSNCVNAFCGGQKEFWAGLL